MLRNPSVLAALALAAAGTSACVQAVWSPPAGYVPLDGPRPLDEGEVRVGASFGAGGVGIGADLFGGGIAYRRGLGDIEVQGEAAAVVVAESSEADTFPAIFSTRVGVKGRLVPGFDHLAWRAGGGFGASAGGIFSALDAGLVLGWDNPYIVPFIEGSGIVSVPLTSADVDITKANEDDVVIDHPVTTFGGRVTAGLAIHAGSYATFGLGASFVFLHDIDGVAEQVTQLVFGVEVPL